MSLASRFFLRFGIHRFCRSLGFETHKIVSGLKAYKLLASKTLAIDVLGLSWITIMHFRLLHIYSFICVCGFQIHRWRFCFFTRSSASNTLTHTAWVNNREHAQIYERTWTPTNCFKKLTTIIWMNLQEFFANVTFSQAQVSTIKMSCETGIYSSTLVRPTLKMQELHLKESVTTAEGGHAENKRLFPPW